MSEFHSTTRRQVRGHADFAEGIVAPPKGTTAQVRAGFKNFMARRGLTTHGWNRSARKKLSQVGRSVPAEPSVSVPVSPCKSVSS